MDRLSEYAVWAVVGALVGGAAVAVYGRLADQAPAPAADAPARVAKNPRLAEAGRRGIAASGLNSRRYTCAECGHGPTTAGPLGVHHKATGHTGRVEVSK